MRDLQILDVGCGGSIDTYMLVKTGICIFNVCMYVQ